jgi:aspartyl-tRNA(Asn)/glutamyl-tRNA(Gln) amidotransferase subunit A
MPSGDPTRLTALGARELRDGVRAGAVSPVALVEACLARIAELDGHLRAWVHVDETGARAQAAAREAEARAGTLRGPLHGVPVGVKDIFDVAGMPTTAGARPWAHTRPTADSAAVATLRAAGAIVLGKTATTEFAYRDPAPTRNPWRADRTPGGSSAGSAAAVAARMVPLALGSQTVGSVLRPAAYCGIVGYKGPHGSIPLDGVVPLAWSFDHVGIFARAVADVALALQPFNLHREVDVRRPPRVALAPDLLARADVEVAAQVQSAADAFARAGAGVEEVKLPPSFADIHAAGLVMLVAEAAAYHEPRFARHAGEYGPEIRGLVEAGLRRPATDYVRADRARARFRADVALLLQPFDLLLCPTAPGLPPGPESTGDGAHCAPWSYVGFPAITLPSGVAPSRLPHAVQLVSHVDPGRLLSFAAWAERVLDFMHAPDL